jgi:MFS transporter, PAT family, beta-lactamase induction signal transducer AmpG
LSGAARSPPDNTPGAGWLAALSIYRQPRVVSMLFLGFSAGLPFYLVYSTLSAWLRQAGIERTTIGMLAWVGILYSMKFLWAPVVDRVRPPFLHRVLGRRRGWMLLAQLGIAIGLVNIGLSDPAAGVRQVALWALFTTFCAATQDIALDAWRIESAALQLQGAMLGAYQIGYRVALICGGAGALAIAGHAGWHASYSTMAALVSVGVVATLLVPEPRAAMPRAVMEREAQVTEWLERRAHWPQSLRSAGEWFIGAVICPLTDFFGRYGPALALVTLAFIGVYRLTEFTMGSMVNPFYIDRGFTLTQIATVVKLYGLLMSLCGVFLAGVLIAKLGLWRSLLLGSVLIVASNLGFAALASARTPTLLGLGAVNGLDNLALAMHGTALLTFLSGLTSAKYTATQYALFSSLYALPGKILEGTSGMVVDHTGYPRFFLYTAALALPGLILLYVLKRRGAFGTTPAAGLVDAADGT